MTTIDVIGQNGYIYDALFICKNFYLVGKFIVEVDAIEGKVIRTMCRATKSNLSMYRKLH